MEPLAAHILENLEAALADSSSDWAPTPVRDPPALSQGRNPRAQEEGLRTPFADSPAGVAARQAANAAINRHGGGKPSPQLPTETRGDRQIRGGDSINGGGSSGGGEGDGGGGKFETQLQAVSRSSGSEAGYGAAGQAGPSGHVAALSGARSGNASMAAAAGHEATLWERPAGDLTHRFDRA